MRTVTLRDVCERIDYGLTTSATTSGGPKFLRITDIESSHVDWDRVPHCTAAADEVQKYALASGDVVVARTGASTGRSQWVQVREPTVFASYLVRFRAGPGIGSRFLGYLLASRSWHEYVSSFAHGKSAQPNMSASAMADFAFTLPPAKDQRAIAEALGALDDKISANGRVLAGLDKLSLACFDASVGTAERLARVEDLAEFHNRRRVPLSSREREARRGDVPYYGAAGRLDSVDGALFDERLVLVGEDGTVIRDDGRPVVQYIWGPAWVNNHAHVLSGRTISTELLRLALQRSNVSHLVTGAVQPKLSMGNLKSLSVTLPADVSQLDARLQGFAAAMRAVIEERRRLAATRDGLLPLLMSGRVRVQEAEQVVEEVL